MTETINLVKQALTAVNTILDDDPLKITIFQRMRLRETKALLEEVERGLTKT